MNGNLRVGQLFGIPFYVNISWFLVLGLMTLSYGNGLAGAFPSLSGTWPWVLGLVAALLLFGSVLAHELGHSFAARRLGIGVNSITLFLFGGLAALEKESENPGGAFQVAIAGPLVSFALFAVLTAVGQGLALGGPLGAIVSLLAYINLALGVFNLLPGLPLDGGNVLKALVWRVTGNPYQGTVFASRAGQIIGWFAIGIGAAAVLGISSFGTPWTLLIGWFLLSNANRAGQSAVMQQRLQGLSTADAAWGQDRLVKAQTSLRQFVDDALFATEAVGQPFLVTDDAEQLVGTLSMDAVKDVPRDRWADTRVADVMAAMTTVPAIAADQSLLEAVQLINENRWSTLAVTRRSGEIIGLLDRQAILKLAQG